MQRYYECKHIDIMNDEDERKAELAEYRGRDYGVYFKNDLVNLYRAFHTLEEAENFVNSFKDGQKTFEIYKLEW